MTKLIEFFEKKAPPLFLILGPAIMKIGYELQGPMSSGVMLGLVAFSASAAVYILRFLRKYVLPKKLLALQIWSQPKGLEDVLFFLLLIAIMLVTGVFLQT